jgi:hypothetical protein
MKEKNEKRKRKRDALTARESAWPLRIGEEVFQTKLSPQGTAGGKI